MRGPRRIYALGAGWLAVVTKLPFGVILGQGVLIFIPFDLIKVSLTTLVAVAMAPAIATPNAQKRGSPGRAR
jgi:biotin transporter BioY